MDIRVLEEGCRKGNLGRYTMDEKDKVARKIKKVNLMIARIFFDMDVESDYFKRLNNARLKVRVSVK